MTGIQPAVDGDFDDDLANRNQREIRRRMGRRIWRGKQTQVGQKESFDDIQEPIDAQGLVDRQEKARQEKEACEKEGGQEKEVAPVILRASATRGNPT